MSVLIYIAFLVVNLIIVKLHENKKFSSNFRLFFFIVLCLNIFLFGVLRFDVGNDYSNYVDRYYGIRDYDVFVTPDYFLFKMLTNLFSSLQNGYLYVIGVYYITTMGFFLRFFKKNNILFWGIFTLITFGFYFDILDRIRQLAALSLFIYTIDDLNKNNFKGYFVKVILASLLHISAIIMLPFFFFSKIKLPDKAILLIYFLAIVGFFIGLWSNLIVLIYDNIPYYNEIYRNSKYYGQADDTSTSLGFLGKTLFILINILYSPINLRLKTLLTLGLLISIIGVGNLNIERIADYLLLFTIYSFPLLLKVKFERKTNRVLLLLPTILFLLILFTKDNNQEYFKYQTIFSDNYKYQIFKTRNYK